MRSVLILFTIVILSGCNTGKKISAGTTATNPVIAHRGAWKKNNLPENSIASLKQAIVLGCAGSEFDVRMTADDSLVINHDPAYNGMAIEKTNYNQLLTHTLANGEKIPTLREYITAGVTGNTKTKLIIEIKPSDISKERGQLVALKVLHLTRELNAQSMVQFISFDYDILKKIISTDAAAVTQYLEGDHSPEQLRHDGISGADFHFSVYEEYPGWIALAKNNNIFLNAWTVNDEKKIRELLASGIQFITTNEPELALEIYRSGLEK